MYLKNFVTVLLLGSSLPALSQQPSSDTVIVPLAESSRIIFTIQDRKDLEVLRHYDFQKLFEDIFDKLEGNNYHATDSAAEKREETADREEQSTEEASDEEESSWSEHDSGDDSNDKHVWSRRGKVGQTWHSYNLDLGTNNFLQDDQFPTGGDLYAVRPWGSWYVGINSVQRTKLGTNVFVEWALGVSWYNFKFEEDNTIIRQDELGVHFETDSRDVDFIKSKLSATFINASLVPVLDFGEHSRKPRIWDGSGDGFRFGIGPYVGYRISSKTKLVYKQDDDREKEKEHDDFYLNNLRYGFRLQIGVRSTDLFVNYDMNELFAEGKGPGLNAISFGLIF